MTLAMKGHEGNIEIRRILVIGCVR